MPDTVTITPHESQGAYITATEAALQDMRASIEALAKEVRELRRNLQSILLIA